MIGRAALAFQEKKRAIALGVPCERMEKDETSGEGMCEGREGAKGGRG